MLHHLSTLPDWKKPHGGLRKLFLGEVAGKRVVVQGLWIGEWCWGEDLPSDGAEDNEHEPKKSGSAGATAPKAATSGISGTVAGPGQSQLTAAPWARQGPDNRANVLEATRGLWATAPVPRR